MNVRAIAGGMTVLVLSASLPLLAHHALTAEYDPKAPVTLAGRIIKVEWINPHSFAEVQCQTADGASESWRVEIGSPASLAKANIRDRLAVDTAVTIHGFRAKDGSLRAYGVEITFSDGVTRKLDGSMVQALPDDLPPPSYIEQLMSDVPVLPYAVAAAPVVVLVAGLLVLRRRRINRDSVPQ